MKTLLVALALLAAPGQVAARDGVSVEGLIFDDGTGSRASQVEWSLSREGVVRIKETPCPVCRAFRRFEYRFEVDADFVRQVDALLPFDLVESATRAPCRLPNAETAWVRPVRVSVPDRAGVSQTHSFFNRCDSSELSSLRARLDEATRALKNEIARRSIPPEKL